jgi:hypothetical protein
VAIPDASAKVSAGETTVQLGKIVVTKRGQ